MLTSAGYPGSYPKGMPVSGIDSAEELDNVQVFPGTQTLQELELIPLPERAPAGTAQPPVDIPPQSL